MSEKFTWQLLQTVAPLSEQFNTTAVEPPEWTKRRTDSQPPLKSPRKGSGPWNFRGKSQVEAYRENESLAVKEEKAKETLRITISTERDFDSHRERFRFPPREILIPTEKVWSFFSSDSRWGEESGLGGDSVRGGVGGGREGGRGGESGRGSRRGSRESGSRESGVGESGSRESQSGIGDQKIRNQEIKIKKSKKSKQNQEIKGSRGLKSKEIKVNQNQNQIQSKSRNQENQEGESGEGRIKNQESEIGESRIKNVKKGEIRREKGRGEGEGEKKEKEKGEIKPRNEGEVDEPHFRKACGGSPRNEGVTLDEPCIRRSCGGSPRNEGELDEQRIRRACRGPPRNTGEATAWGLLGGRVACSKRVTVVGQCFEGFDNGKLCGVTGFGNIMP
ncbi:hypothetical protein H6P81_003314 [Aristolochia fimbriata]|uniref:Uncharacterized protein n=1 Tax=Aristolochia fimbriata TaxID=158543 RepID=A0AAV7FG43_ARIFI|nr:hypothetical protein H6P81_003314 [Aristolochia fimbriata]